MQELWNSIVHEFQTPFTNSVLIFSVILFIILLVPIIFNRFKIPGIIGLIISGVIIGPHGLFLIQKNSAVNLFSTIGLLYIMFIAGLELDLGEFRKNKNKSLVFGFFTFIIPLAIGFPVCYYLFDFQLNSSLLIASMFATHTLIAYPIVTRLGIAKNQAVAVAVGGTILTDTAVLIILAMIAGSANGGLTYAFWTRLGISLLIFSLVVFLLVPRVAAWFFKRLEDEKSAHFIFVLSVVFFCAFLAELSGLEPIIGAFAAGLTLNRLIPHTSSLMNRIEFVGNSLFIPFFLISVGMIIDVRVIANGFEPIVIALSLTTVAIFSKWLAAKISSSIYSFSREQSNLIFGLSSAHAAATLAVILVGYNLKIIDDNVLNGTILLILITCVVASFVTENAGKQILVQTKDEPEHPISRQHFLVPIANPDTMEKLVDFALMMKNPKDDSAIIGLTIVKDDEQAQQRIVQSNKLLEKVLVHAAASDSKVEIMITIDRNVTSGIKRIAREKFITDIVLGWSPDKSLADIIFGKTFDSLVKQTSQNIYITNFKMPLNVHRNMILICPMFADKETGFFSWVDSVMRSANRLRMKVHLFSTSQVRTEILKYLELTHVTVEITPHEILDLSQIKKLDQAIQPEDMVILASSREGGISYTPLLDVLPKKMTRQFPKSSFVFIYPATTAANAISNYEQEITGGLLEKGLGLFRNAGRIFGKKIRS
jgi:Kef-type K+ transport system membrane component KefB